MTLDEQGAPLRAVLGAAALAVTLHAVPGCARSDMRPAAHVEQPEPSSSSNGDPTLRRSLSDDDIALAVTRRIGRASSLPGPLVQVKVTNGIVTLLGRVNRGDERLRAAELAERTRGVRAVVNRLAVAPGWSPKSDLAREIRAWLLEQSEDEFANVTVTAEGSDVRLGGFVSRARGKEMAESAAWYVPGVTRVDNQIRVRPKFVRTDEEITEDVVRSLHADPYVGDAALDVSVEEGRVRLSGAVGSMFERRRARERALLAGVVEVDDEAVRVLPESVPSAGRNPPPSTDRDISLAIRAAFRADPRIPEQGVDFSVNYGVVTLTGQVRTLSQKLAAAEDARYAVGTWAVVNRLKVRPEGAAPQRDAARRVAARLGQHPAVNADGIRVTADGGAVVLNGEVSSLFERSAAERATAAVFGVTGVENRLVVRVKAGAQRSDAEIQAAIERELWWDPRVGSAKIDVNVENGVATLRGEVRNAETYDAVLENAFEAAPPKLVDELWQRRPARFLYSN